MFCQACGRENPDRASFCAGCGASLQASSQQPSMERGFEKVSNRDIGSRSHGFHAEGRGKRKPLIFAVLAAAVVGVAVFAGMQSVSVDSHENLLAETSSQEGSVAASELPAEVRDAMADAAGIARGLVDSELDDPALSSERENVEGRLRAGLEIVSAALDEASEEEKNQLTLAQAAMEDTLDTVSFFADYLAATEASQNQDSEMSFAEELDFASSLLSSGYDVLSSGSAPAGMGDYSAAYAQAMLPVAYALDELRARAGQGSASQFDVYTLTEVLDRATKEEETYLERLEQMAVQILSAAASTLEGDVMEPSIECSMVSEVYPNAYPSANSLVNLDILSSEVNKEIAIEVELDGLTQKYEQKERLRPGYNYLMIKPAVLSSLDNLDSSRDTQLNVKVTDVASGEVLVQESKTVALHSIYDMNWYTNEFGATSRFNILSWLRPESEVVQNVNRIAIEYLETTFGSQYAMLPGYQNGYGLNEAQTVALQVGAIQTAISSCGVRYKTDSYSFGAAQHVLTPDQVIKGKSGLCIETSLLMASCLESLGMHTILAFPPGHAQVFVETWSGSGEYLLVETTALPYAGISLTDDGVIQYDEVLQLVVGNGNFDEYLSRMGCEASDLYLVDSSLRVPMGLQGIEHA